MPFTSPIRVRRLCAALLLGFFAPVPEVQAQLIDPLLPFEFEGDVFISDTSLDKIFHLADLNFDGDYFDPGEVEIFYDDLVGALPLSNNSSIAFNSMGRLYATDRAEGWILEFVDWDGDGKAESGGEATIFFDGDPLVNGSGLEMIAPVAVTSDLQDVLWVAEVDQGGQGKDSILRMFDANFDGDANDAGEVVRYFEPVPGLLEDDTIIVDLFVGADAVMYYVEGSTTGFRPQGLYRLADSNSNGLIDLATEVTALFLIPPSPFQVFLQAGALGEAGYMYLTDTGNDVIWRVRDDDGNGTVDLATEAKVFLIAPLTSLIWDLAPTASGRVLYSGIQGAGRVVDLNDDNGDGTINPLTELTEKYSSFASPVNIANPRGLAWGRRPTLVMPNFVPVGSQNTGQLLATAGDTGFIFYSTGVIPPLAIAPFGFLELDLTPAAFSSGVLAVGIVPARMPMQFNIQVPNLPGLVGLVVYFQALAGKPNRFQASSLSSLVVQ